MMMCPRCDGQGQVVNQVVILEEIVGYSNDIIEHIEEYLVLEPCPDCYEQWITCND